MMSQPVPYLPKARNNLYKKKIYLLPQRHHLPQGIHIPLEISLMILLYFLCIVVVIAFFEITSLTYIISRPKHSVLHFFCPRCENVSFFFIVPLIPKTTLSHISILQTYT